MVGAIPKGADATLDSALTGIQLYNGDLWVQSIEAAPPPTEPPQPFQGIDHVQVSGSDGRQPPPSGLQVSDPTYIQDAEFSNWLDSLGAPNNVLSPRFEHFLGSSYDFIFPMPDTERAESTFESGPQQLTTHHQLQDEAAQSLSRFGSRLPSLEPVQTPSRDRTRDIGSEKSLSERMEAGGMSTANSHINSYPWLEVTTRSREQILSNMTEFAAVLPEGFTLPSKHALSRFIAAYAMTFDKHNPVLHLQTLVLDDVAVELFLIMASIGARYCREQRRSEDMFQMAKAVVFERFRRLDNVVLVESFSQRRLATPDAEITLEANRGPFRDWTRLESIQALLLMVSVSTWSGRKLPARAREAAILRSMLDVTMREKSFDLPEITTGASWDNWCRLETMKRLKLHAFCLFNLQTIAYDTPPTLLWSDINLNLPCTERQWRAADASSWGREQNQSDDVSCFSLEHLMKYLFRCADLDQPIDAPAFSSFGGYVPIHAIIQHIWLLQHAAQLVPHATLQQSDCVTIEDALRQWRYGWERNKESSMDPISPNGPLAFTSTALLRWAYVRITACGQLTPSLAAWNPLKIAHLLSQAPPLPRSDRVTRAALHCAHALSIPVKLGIGFVAHNQAFFWSNQHALCSLESAMLLSKWLEAVTTPDLQPPLTVNEARLLQFVNQIVAETEHGALGKDGSQSRRLNSAIVRVWAKLFCAESVWEMVNLVGESMQAYADMLESQ